MSGGKSSKSAAANWDWGELEDILAWQSRFPNGSIVYKRLGLMENRLKLLPAVNKLQCSSASNIEPQHVFGFLFSRPSLSIPFLISNPFRIPVSLNCPTPRNKSFQCLIRPGLPDDGRPCLMCWPCSTVIGQLRVEVRGAMRCLAAALCTISSVLNLSGSLLNIGAQVVNGHCGTAPIEVC